MKLIKYILAVAIFFVIIAAEGCEFEVVEKIYPNPVTSELNVDLVDEFLEDPFEIKYQIVGINGNIYQIGVFTERTNTISCYDLPKGSYILSLPDYGMTKTFIKQ